MTADGRSSDFDPLSSVAKIFRVHKLCKPGEPHESLKYSELGL